MIIFKTPRRGRPLAAIMVWCLRLAFIAVILAAGVKIMANPPFTLSEALAQKDQNDVAPYSVAVGASPATLTNSGTAPIDLIVDGGTVSALEFSRDGSTFYDVGVTAGIVGLSSGDMLKITHTGAPTVTAIPR